MCLWFRRKPDIESGYDQRVGNSKITSPIPGAYADPVSPPLTKAIDTTYTLEATPVSVKQLSSIAEVYQKSHTEQRGESKKISPRTSEPAQKSQPSQPSQSRHNSSATQDAKRLSTSTQFSSHHSIDGSPSPSLSSRWLKSPDSGHNLSQPPSRHQSPVSSPGHPPSTTECAQSFQSGYSGGDRNSQSPMPVHQAYIPPDQLSIGAKLSPGLTVDTVATPPTTGGLHTGKSQFSHIFSGSSTTASPIDGRNPWGSRSATGSPIDGRNPWNNHRESRNSTSGLLHGGHTIKEEEKGIEAPWERQMPVAKVPLPGVVQETLTEANKREEAKKEEARKEERNKMGKIYIPIPDFILGSAPKKWERHRKDMSPDAASPETTTSTKTVEQWPGEM